MANMSFTNNAATTLAGTLASGGTSLTVQTGTGALFPTLAGSQYFYATLANVSGTVEIIKVTARSTDTFTVTRGQDGTSAVGWSIGDKVELRLVAASLNDFPKLDEANTFTGANAYGTPASLVLTNATGLPVAGGGTGATTLAANNVLLGNGTGALQVVAPSTSGNVLTSNGTTWVSTGSAGGVFGQVFTSSGTFTVPAGVTALKVTVAGGSGAGGSAVACAYSGGGGGGSGTANSFLTGLTPGLTITVTVGGVSGTSTITSGTQTITTVSAAGGGTGGAGTSLSSPTGGAGGTASGGTQNISGSQGSYGGTFAGVGGAGGVGGGAGGDIHSSSNGASGGAGRVGNNGLSPSGTTGAAGQSGVVIFEW